MISASVMTTFLIGFILGLLFVWAFFRQRTNHMINQYEKDLAGEKMLYEEKLQTQFDQNSKLAEGLDSLNTQNRKLNNEIRDESGKRLTAEEKISKFQQLEENLERFRNENIKLREENSGLKTKIDEERKSTKEKLEVLNNAQEDLSNSFKALSGEALKQNNQTFLDLAKQVMEKHQNSAKADLESRHNSISELVKPIKDSLGKFDSKVVDLEVKRESAYSALNQQVKSLAITHDSLKMQATNLTNALKTPSTRGRWGEIQLRNVVEMAGMLDYCDFQEQASKPTENGSVRPDMIIKLPANKIIVIDSKAPLASYLKAHETDDESLKNQLLKKHAQDTKSHLKALSGKAYWEQFSDSPEFVVMYLPGESIFSGALQQDSLLIEEGIRKKVILASPLTLISLLMVVAHGWKQEQIAESTREIADLGKELHERICSFANHLTKLGKGLSGAVDSYNSAVGSLDKRVLVTARKFDQLGASSKGELVSPKTINRIPSATH